MEVIEASNPPSRLEVTLTGPAAEGGRLRVDTLIEVVHAVQTAVTRLAFGLRGGSTIRPGRPPRDVSDLTRLEIVGLREGSAVLEFGLAEYQRPLDDLDLGQEALELFERGVVAMAQEQPPPEPWDSGVIRAVERLVAVFDKGVDEIVVGHAQTPVRARAVLTRATFESRQGHARRGTRERIEVEGRLLMADFAATREEARIHRPLEPPVRCVFGPELEELVLRLLRRYVRATGWAELDDAGNVRALELETLEDAELDGGRSFWDLPTLGELAEEQRVEPVERLEDLADGTWPEDESVDEFLAVIESYD